MTCAKRKKPFATLGRRRNPNDPGARESSMAVDDLCNCGVDPDFRAATESRSYAARAVDGGIRKVPDPFLPAYRNDQSFGMAGAFDDLSAITRCDCRNRPAFSAGDPHR